MGTVLLLVALGVAIAIHELGHLLGGLLLRLRPTRVALGMGPPLLHLERRGVRWVLGAVPLGAGVDLDGMNPHGAHVASPLRRLGVLALGPLANLGIAFLILASLYRSGTHVPVPMTVGAVIAGSEGARAQLRPGDRVETVDDYLPRGWSDLLHYLEDRPGAKVVLKVKRAATGKVERISVRPQPDGDRRGRIGIRQQYVYRSLAWGPALGMAAQHEGRVVGQTFALARAIVSRAGASIFTPTGHVHSLAVEAASGWDAFWRAVVTLSVGLGLFHLLPFPSLDGARMALTAFEVATGRKVPGKLETTVHTLGFLAFVVLVGLVATRDLQQVFRLAAG